MMRKLWVLAWKEVRLAFRDVGGIITMLVSPLVLTLVIGAAFSGGSAPLSGIPVLLLDLDQSGFSEMLIDVFAGDDVQQLIALETVTDEVASRMRVEADEVAALVVIPAGFGDRVFPLASMVETRLGLDLLSLDPESTLSDEQQRVIASAYTEARQVAVEPAVIEIYASPDWRLSTSIVKSVIRQGLAIMDIQVQGSSIIISRLFAAQPAGPDQTSPERSGLVPARVWDVQQGFADVGFAGTDADPSQALPIETMIVSGSGRSFDWTSYTAVSMAVLFLMFAVTSGGRTLLAERRIGTLSRLLASPISAPAVLVGKMAGVVLTGVLQMILLWGATSLIGAYWGPAPAVLVSILMLVICASGVGALISAWSKNSGQASAIGTAVTLVGSAISGTFFPRSGLPAWIQTAGLITPNAWGIEIFSRLQLGRGVLDILPQLGGVLLLTLLYYVVALLGFRRQFD